MKQGSATHDGRASTKVEPKSMGMNPAGVSQFGEALGYRGESVHEGRGLKAPMASSTIHHGGSQGKHK